MSAVLREQLEELCAITERQLDAARRLDPVALSEANAERGDALFALRVELAEGIPRDDPTLRELAENLADLEDRLTRVAKTVLQSLGDPSSPVYDRSGRVG